MNEKNIFKKPEKMTPEMIEKRGKEIEEGIKKKRESLGKFLKILQAVVKLNFPEEESLSEFTELELREDGSNQEEVIQYLKRVKRFIENKEMEIEIPEELKKYFEEKRQGI